MGGYVGTKAVNLSTTAADVSGNATIGGNLTVSGTTVTIDSANAQMVNLGDNDRIRLGDGDDLELYHNGSASIIKDDGVGDLYVGGDNNILITNAALNENKGKFISNGAVELYYDNSKKFETTATGVAITSTLKVAGSSVVTASTDADDLVIEKTGDTGLSILSTTTGRIYFGDAANDDAGSIRYVHSDNSMRFETDDAERLRITSAGYIEAASASQVRLTLGNEGTAGTNTANWIRGNGTVLGFNSASGGYGFEIGGTPRVTISSSGNVGIGTTSPSEQINLVGSSGASKIRFDGDSSNLQNNFIGITGYDDLIIASDEANSGSASTIQFRVDASERMRIDASGNLLVGHSGSGSYPFTGHTIRGGDSAIFSRTGSTGETLQVRRQNSTGELVRFYSGSNTNAGGIKLDGGSMVIGGGDVGIGYYQGANALVPYNFDNLAVRDAEIDLGYPSSFRWKDLYLSGGAYLGGTTSANKLEDYEEGTFTYSMVGGTSGSWGVRTGYATGFYTKVGRVVHIQLRFESTSRSSPQGNLEMTGFPFATENHPSSGNGSFQAPVLLRGNSNSNVASHFLSFGHQSTTGTFMQQEVASTTISAVNSNTHTTGNIEGTVMFSYVTNE